MVKCRECKRSGLESRSGAVFFLFFFFSFRLVIISVMYFFFGVRHKSLRSI